MQVGVRSGGRDSSAIRASRGGQPDGPCCPWQTDVTTGMRLTLRRRILCDMKHDDLWRQRQSGRQSVSSISSGAVAGLLVFPAGDGGDRRRDRRRGRVADSLPAGAPRPKAAAVHHLEVPLHEGRPNHAGRPGIRATGLDELPQFINILRGDMSAVGPRPLTEFDVARLGWLARRYDFRWRVLPGLTGLAQVTEASSGRQSLGLDRRYVARPSLLLDVRLLAVSFAINAFGKRRVRRLLVRLRRGSPVPGDWRRSGEIFSRPPELLIFCASHDSSHGVRHWWPVSAGSRTARSGDEP